MPEPNRFRPTTGQNNGEPPRDVSLSDLLPDLLEEPASKPIRPAQSNRSAPSYRAALSSSPASDFAEPVYKERKSNRGLILLGVVALIGMLVIPLLIFGFFVFLANNQKELTPEQLVEAAKTPLPTIIGITPVAPKATPTVSTVNCSNPPALGPVDGYPCARSVEASPDWNNFFTLAELDLNQAGYRPVGAERAFYISRDSQDKILQFYDKSLKDKGFSPGRAGGAGADNANGNTSLGNFRVAYYLKGNQQVQILALTLNRNGPGGTADSGETIIRLSAS
ncbi:MAG TPA: hypothetical protein VH186_19865 [Chloroflexia bacterium]|nr:hypothetical protein [Chloroflexia bacterium]